MTGWETTTLTLALIFVIVEQAILKWYFERKLKKIIDEFQNLLWVYEDKCKKRRWHEFDCENNDSQAHQVKGSIWMNTNENKTFIQESVSRCKPEWREIVKEKESK